MILSGSRVRLFILGATLVVAVPIATVLASHSWGGYHWERSSNPVTLNVVGNTSAAWDTYLDGALADWEAPKAPNIFSFSLTDSNPVRVCRTLTDGIRVCSGNFGNTGWLGIAQISVKNGHIQASLVAVNDTYFRSEPYNTDPWKQMVMCQEIGHTLGLDHQDENFDNDNLGSCMDYTSHPLGNEHPNGHDYQMLSDVYSHLDAVSTDGGGGGDKKCGSPPCKNAAGGPANAAALAHGLPDGVGPADGDVFVSPARDGATVITFVTWVQ